MYKINGGINNDGNKRANLTSIIERNNIIFEALESGNISNQSDRAASSQHRSPSPERKSPEPKKLSPRTEYAASAFVETNEPFTLVHHRANSFPSRNTLAPQTDSQSQEKQSATTRPNRCAEVTPYVVGALAGFAVTLTTWMASNNFGS